MNAKRGAARAGLADPGPQGRTSCPACRRPEGWCYCAHVTPTRTRTQVVVLQHPREARVPLGTLRMVQLSLPDAVVRRGIEFAGDPVVDALIARDPAPYVLYPGPGAEDLATVRSEGPITLIAIDGTWAQARSVLRHNPALRALPCVAFSPGAPSAYRIRRQPAEHCVSTIEALARALDLLEPGETQFDDVLLRPLHALVEAQLRCSRERKQYRTQRPRRRVQKPPPLDSARNLRAHWDHLVCVQGELNDWPADHPDRPPPEVVQWHACRVATGETFSATVRPRQPLGPYTPQNVEVSADLLMAGVGWPEFTERWRTFARPDDVLAVWGHFHAAVAAKEGLPLPTLRVDTRVAASRALGRRPGTIERCSETLGLQVAVDGPGRCDRRIAHLTAVVQSLVEGASPRDP